MSTLRALVSALIVASFVFFASVSGAQVSCTINGSITLEPSDSYYCDTEILGTSACTSWREKDLDSTTVPIAFMNVCVQLDDNSKLDCTNSDANGNWSATFTLPGTQCAGQQVDIRHYFARVHEDDVASDTPRLRFSLVDVDEGDPAMDDSVPGNHVWTKADAKTLEGPISTHQRAWTRGSIQTTTRLANIFYTASSYLKEATTWSPNLDAQFTAPWSEVPLRIGYEETFPNGAVTLDGDNILIGYDAFSLGFFVRHELGHATHHHAHHDDIDGTCATYNFCSSCPLPANSDEQSASEVRNCEYGSAATDEGLASFFAVRSITNNDTQAWDCSCADYDSDGSEPGDTANWDLCSEQALLMSDPDGDSDWMWNCNAGDFAGLSFIYVGDFRASSTANCARLRADGGCNCAFSGSPLCDSTYNSTTGWRNSSQVMRFFWDMIDSSTDGGQDDTNIGIDTFVANLEGMPCVGFYGGIDGSCEEHAIPVPCGSFPFPPCECSPALDGETSPSGTGTRDSYNVWDIAEVISGDQFDERTLNCVQGAQD